MTDRTATRMAAWLVLMGLAILCGLNPFDGTTIFWVGVLSLWVLA